MGLLYFAHNVRLTFLVMNATFAKQVLFIMKMLVMSRKLTTNALLKTVISCALIARMAIFCMKICVIKLVISRSAKMESAFL